MSKIRSFAIRTIVALSLVLTGWFGREAVGFKEVKEAPRAPEPPSVAVVTVTNALFNPSTEYVGHVEAVQMTDILPQIDGYIRRVCFTEGARVEKGDLLFEIDPEQYLAAKNLRHSEVASAKAKVTVALPLLAALTMLPLVFASGAGSAGSCSLGMTFFGGYAACALLSGFLAATPRSVVQTERKESL